MQTERNTVDPAEVAKFEAMAAEWWDVNGKFSIGDSVLLKNESGREFAARS